MKEAVILFPGQNSLNLEKVREEYIKNKTLEGWICNISKETQMDLKEAIFHDDSYVYQNLEVLSVLIFTLSIATFNMCLEEQKDNRIILAGHSLGEISALACADAVSYDDALKIVVKRAQIAKSIAGKMFIITKLETEYLESICKSCRINGLEVWICCYNGEKQNCIAGNEQDLREVINIIEGMDGEVTEARGVPPYHCRMMENGKKVLRKYLTDLEIRQPKYAVFSGAYGIPYSDEESVIDFLSEQLAAPIQWMDIIRYFKRLNNNEFIEMGYSHILSNLVNYNIANI